MMRTLERLVEDYYENRIEWSEVATAARNLEELFRDAQVASGILGRLTPFVPEVQDAPDGETMESVDMAIRGLDDLLGPNDAGGIYGEEGKYRYPQLESAVRWLTDRGVVTADSFRRLSQAAKEKSFPLWG